MSQRIVFDVGLHRGEDTEYYLARGFRVIAIEANPELVHYCENRFKTHIQSSALTIVHGAVVQDDGASSVRFYKNKKTSVWGTVVRKWADRNAALGADSEEIEVPVVNFDRLLSEHGCPHYLKIDIEGMDLVCLKKLLRTNSRPKWVSLESDKVDFASIQEEFSVLEQLGYRRYYIQQQADIDKRRLTINSQEGEYVDYRFPTGSSGPFGNDLSGPWLSKEEALDRYSRIFVEYRMFGDSGIVRRWPLGRYAVSAMSKIVGRPLPGWYDTHAMLE